MTVKNFDYTTLNHLVLTPQIVAKLSHIYELRGRLSTIPTGSTPALTRLVDIAKVQSVDSSNRIEGVFTTDKRLNDLMQRKTTPSSRSEEEISGYRDVLDLIHTNYPYIPITTDTILGLHKQLFNYTGSNWGGHFKDINNEIITQFADGTSRVRFTPPPAHLTPELITDLCVAYNQGIQDDRFSPLIISGAFIFDFVSIHPFRDGNGRMSRLLMLLTLYQNHFDAGKYVSIEQLIEKTKFDYYARLQQSSQGWQANTNDYEPFLDYYLSVILQAYRDLDDRINLVADTASVTKLIMHQLHTQLRPLSKRELMANIPQYSQKSIERGLTTLQKEQAIVMVGHGRASKYALTS